ncbi:hypothetical protein [Microbacterium suaedae]|uniref:hypothetical protein n=1 Tax=Microbacterium suaedae TaxID=2067813 RepID=UPI000DA1E654|nr:hypothetical protein [Microbacterium suaedae]
MNTSSRTATNAAALHPAGDMCAHATPGHDLHPVQRRLAAATPTRWIDAIAGSTSDDGRLDLWSLDGELVARVWHHEHLAEIARTGSPVALHTGYHVLAAAGAWHNVADEERAPLA